MVEIYCFINPIDVCSVKRTEYIYDLIQQQKQKYKFHIIPIANFNLICDYVQKNTANRCLKNYNNGMDAVYNLALDYEALATFNRCKAARYLRDINPLLQKNPYSRELSDQVLRSLDICLPRFYKRKGSALTKERVQRNQELAQQMGVTSLPSHIIFNFNVDQDYGIVLDANEDIHLMENLLEEPSIEKAVSSL